MNINYLLQKPESELSPQEKKALEYHLNSRVANNKASEQYWLDRMKKALGLDPSKSRAEKYKPIRQTNHRPSARARGKSKAFLKLSGIFGEIPKTDKERIKMAYKAYRANQITKRQARALGCVISGKERG